MEVLFVSRDMPPLEAALIERVLADHGARAHRVDSYKKAVEALVRRKYGIAILFSFASEGDFMITEAVRLMKKISPSLSVIAISRETPLEIERELRTSGLYFHLTIPFEKSELEDVISGAIGRNHSRRN